MPFPRPVTAVVFDMDGLLIDSEKLYAVAMQSAGDEFGVVCDMDLYRAMVGHTHAVCNTILYERLGPDFPVDAFWPRAWAHVEALVAAQLTLKAGVEDLLDHLDELRLPRAIATSNSLEMVDSYLTRLGVRDRFDAVVHGGDVTHRKPHPEPYLTAAARLGVDPAGCLALEDSHPGVLAAHGAGMMTVMVPDILEANEEMHDKCIHIADSLHVVLDLLRRRHD